jgi:uncharacterized membrane protein YeiB
MASDVSRDSETVHVSPDPTITSKASSRIYGYDFARALAYFGMIFVNFKLVMQASDNGPGWLAWLMSLLEGRAAATFVILAGVGLSLLSRKGRDSGDVDCIRQDRATILKRALFLFVFGLLYSPIWPADILHFYGVYLAVGALMLTVPDKTLWRWAGFFMAGFVVLFVLINYETGWDWDTLTTIDFWTPAGMVRHMFYNGFHPVFPWMVFLLVGMWLGRQNVGNPRTRRRIIRRGLIALVMAEGTSGILVQVLTPGDADAAAVFGTHMMPPTPLYLIAASGVALIVIMACVELTERLAGKRWIEPFIATGQLALTLYVAHVIVGMGIMEMLGWLDGETLWLALACTVTFCVASMLFAYWWRGRFARGPLEWVMRQVTS